MGNHKAVCGSGISVTPCEEAFEIEDEEEFRTFDESIRGEMPPGYFKQITLSYNPWIESHWTKTRFWDNEDPEADCFTTTYKCNEWLDDADRRLIEELEQTHPERFKVVGLGEYGIPGGVFFDEFRKDVHVVEPFPLPDYWRRFRFLDYGLDMLAGYWIAIDEHNNGYVYKEVYESDHIISAAAKRLKDMTAADEKITLTYAPPDLWNRRQDTGKSAAEIFGENDVHLTIANNERIQGWLNVKEWLKTYKSLDEQTGEEITTARLKIFRNCVNLIRCLPAVQSDEKDPNDVATEPHELTHAPDALRYFCSMWTVPSQAPKPQETIIQKHKKRLAQQAQQNRMRVV